jgi:hypothetical protein
MNTNSQQFKLNLADARLILYVFFISFLTNILPALTQFQQDFNIPTFEHALITSFIGGIITIVVQLIRPN